MGFQIGEKIKATVKEKTKTTYKFYGGMQCGDLFDCETRVIHPSFDIIGVISIRRKKTVAKLKLLKLLTGKNYRLDKLTNIVKL